MSRIIDLLRNKGLVLQLGFFTLGKIFFAIVQLPKYRENFSFIPLLICVLIFYALSITIKILRHSRSILSKLIKMQSQCFLIWVVTLLSTIFAWGLLTGIQWSVFSRILIIMCQIIQTFIYTLVCKPELIRKSEFVVYQLVLGIGIITLAIKTVVFLNNNSQSTHKDQFLLNFTTQIALSILIMDCIERFYSKHKEMKTHDQMSRVQAELVMVSK